MARPKGSKNAGPPKYRLHAASGRGVVTVNGRVRYLDGKFNSPESRAHYHRLMSELAANGGIEPPAANDDNGPTVAELVLAYWTNYVTTTYHQDTQAHYNRRRAIKTTLGLMNDLYGPTRAKDFDSGCFLAVREAMIARGIRSKGPKQGKPLQRVTVNRLMWNVIHLFRWGTPRRLVPASVYHDIVTVEELQEGRAGPNVTERIPTRDVTDPVVEKTLPHLAPCLQAAVKLQRLTGMRSGELLIMRGVDIDTKPDALGNWTYRPTKFKGQWRNPTYVKEIPLGPQAQEIVKTMLKPDLNAYLFSPADAWTHAGKGSAGKFRVLRRRVGKARLLPHYTPDSYGRAIHVACDLADAEAHKASPETPTSERIVPKWHPHQLRHARCTEVEMKYELDLASAALDHSSVNTTKRYAHQRQQKARRVAAEIG